MKKTGTNTYYLNSDVYVREYQAVVGKKEKEGPLGQYFDIYNEDEYFGQDSYEKAESEMQREAIDSVIRKSQIPEKDIDFIFAGDLLNQCVGANYSVRGLDIGFFGLYGACSTMGEALILGSMSVAGGFAENALSVTSSHFCSAERQFRYPLAYGAQRPPTAQWTVTGAGCVMLSSVRSEGDVRVSDFHTGKITDLGVTDINNMGSAMAPAAAKTLENYFLDTATIPDDYDLIVSGDLGRTGKDIVVEILKRDGIKLGRNYFDCGMLIYDSKQDTHSGGSGCGCSASVLTGYILPQMRNKLYRNVLFMPTGALMSPTTTLQGESIPGIAHLVHFVS